MATEYQRPKFLASYFEAMKVGVQTRGVIAIIPVWLLIGFSAGAASAIPLPSELWTDKQNWQVIVAIYAAMLTVNGLLLALSWGAFSRIHEQLVSTSEFAIFLKRTKLFNNYLFYVDWVHIAQLFALLFCAAAMFSSVIIAIPMSVHKAILGISIGFSIYAIRYAVNAVTMMHDLVWQRAVFEEQEHANPSNVVGLNRPEPDAQR
jgi:hypothetical protein